MRAESNSYTKITIPSIMRVFKPNIRERNGDQMAKQANSLAHTKWMCKYHIVFTPKYRRKIIYNQYRESIRDIIKQLCAYKGVEILEGHLMEDHVHMLVSIPPKYSVSSFVIYLLLIEKKIQQALQKNRMKRNFQKAWSSNVRNVKRFMSQRKLKKI